MQLDRVDYILILFYLLFMGGIGLFFGWFIKDASAYLKGGNTIPWQIAGISNFMTMFSSFIFVAYAGIAYAEGPVAILVLWSTVPAGLFAAMLMANRWRRADILTPVEYLEARFGPGTRQTFSWLGLVLRFLDNAVRLYATGIFIAAVTPLGVTEAIILSGLLIIGFTLIGGLWAVTVMDTLQFVVLIGATLILVPLAWSAAGGIEGIAESAPEQLAMGTGEKTAPLWLLAYYLLLTLKYNSNWSFIQRLYAVRDEASARKVGYLTAGLFAITPFIFLTPPLLAKVILPDLADPEQAYVALCATLLPSGLVGLMVAAMFSATMSSVNSELNSIAGVLTNDVYQRLIQPGASDAKLLGVARMATVLAGVIIIAIGSFVDAFGGAFEANKLFASIFAIPLAIPLIFGLLVRYTNGNGAVLAVVGGAAFALALHLANLWSWEVNTLATLAFTVAAFWLGSLFGRTQGAVDRANALLDKVNRPLAPDAIPTIDPGFQAALNRLFGLSLMIAGGFFLAVAPLSWEAASGRYAFAFGLTCAIAGIALLLRSRALR